MSSVAEKQVREIDQKPPDKSQLISRLAIKRSPVAVSKSPSYKQTGLTAAVIAGVLMIYVFTQNRQILPTTESEFVCFE